MAIDQMREAENKLDMCVEFDEKIEPVKEGAL